MRITLIVTLLNEATALDTLLSSIAALELQPDEVIVVDGGSTDGTLAILDAWSARLPLRVLRRPGANIAAGRNAAIAAASGAIIAVTDAGVRLTPGWLGALVAPFETIAPADRPDVVAGFFTPDPRTLFEIAMGATVLPALDEIDPATFLPSSRSIAFRRASWQAAGGYPEWLDFCEDLIFDLRLREQGARFAFAPTAIAQFRPRGSPGTFWQQYFHYARGDGKAGLFVRRHVIRYATYGALLGWLAWWFGGPRRPPALLWPCILLAGAAYLRRPYRRLWPWLGQLDPAQRLQTIALVPLIRITGDAAKMAGYPVGLWWRWRRYGPRRSWREIAR